MEQLIKVLGPFVDEFELRQRGAKLKRSSHGSNHPFQQLRTEGSTDSDEGSSESPHCLPSRFCEWTATQAQDYHLGSSPQPTADQS